jgi:protein deglycase
MPTALVFLFEGFEEIETVSPIDILRRAEVDVVVASISDNVLVKGRSNLLLQADVLLSALDPDRVFDCVVVPGGPGTKLLRESSTVLSIVKRHDNQHFVDNWLHNSDAPFLTGMSRVGKRLLAYALRPLF